MKEKDLRLVSDMTNAVYSVIGMNGLEFNKENVGRILNVLAEISASLCALSDGNVDEFVNNTKEYCEELSNSETITKCKNLLSSKDSSDQVNELSTFSSNLKEEINSKLSEIMDQYNDPSVTKDSSVILSKELYSSLYAKCLDLMDEKHLLIADMPVMIGCLGILGAHFSEVYGVKKDFIIKNIESYNDSAELYNQKNPIDNNVSSLDKTKETDAVAINVPTKKNPYNLN